MFEGLFDLALMALFLRLGINRGTPGRHFCLYSILYSTGRFFLEYLRADTGPVLAGLTAAQVGSLGAIVMAGLVILWLELRRGRRPGVERSAGAARQ